MPKCICIARCQRFGAIIPKGTVVDIPENELKSPQIAASFRIMNPAETAKKEPEKPLTGENGQPLAKNAQMSENQLKEKLTSMGVKFPETADKPTLFKLLQDALSPNTKK